MSKAIYQPKGKAQEYNQWAVNFYNGCSGKCTYCYNRKGITAKVLGKDEPTIKKTLGDEKTALMIFEKEAGKYWNELKEHGLFFNFVSDPFLPKTERLTFYALSTCNFMDIPCIFLTKQTGWIENDELVRAIRFQDYNTVGFTLTGHDELEPGCSTNQHRIEAMKFLHEKGIRTWASIEPVIDFKSSLEMIEQTTGFCSHYKIGLESGKKFDQGELAAFVEEVNELISYERNKNKIYITVYWKDSVSNQLSTGDKHLVALTHERHIVKANYKFWRTI